jgi:hypothetical protein
MSRIWRILAAVLVLSALMPNAFGRPNVICIESSGRISYSCNDLVPDELNVHHTLPASLGVGSEDCGFCHDYTIGQAVTQSFQTLALPVALIEVHRLDLPQRLSMLQTHSSPVAIVDSSGSISPLKC